jgi:flagellar basal-body rod protein FlgB
MAVAKSASDLGMIDAIFNDSNYVAAKKMLDVTALRHEAIASNIANVETPNYKRMDVSQSFESQLSSAISSRDSAEIAAIQPQMTVDSQAISSRSDGNTVQLETELMKMDQNTVEHSFETQLVTNEFSRMRMAITGKS